jgi:mono/diheme cytochrome c family protein
MKRIAILAAVVAVVLGVGYGVLTAWDHLFYLGRMWETPAVRPHEQPLATAAAGIVPITGGEVQWREAAEEALVPMVDLTDAAAITAGFAAYQNFCLPCHGKNHDGNGTVGQSFAPLPADLRGPKVQAMTPGRIFKQISYGIPGGRQPALAATISTEQRWCIVAYLHSLEPRP